MSAEGIYKYELKRRVYGLYPTLEDFDSTIPIRLIKYLGTGNEAFDSVGASEASAVWTLTYYVEEEEKDVHEAPKSDVDDEFDGETVPSNERWTWRFVLAAQNWRFPTNEVLQESKGSILGLTPCEGTGLIRRFFCGKAVQGVTPLSGNLSQVARSQFLCPGVEAFVKVPHKTAFTTNASHRALCHGLFLIGHRGRRRHSACACR